MIKAIAVKIQVLLLNLSCFDQKRNQLTELFD